MHKILLDDFLKLILKEDIGRGDLYARIQNNTQVESYVVAKEGGVLSGQMYIERLCELLNIKCHFVFDDGKIGRAHV